jgi:adenine-specific DNA-methyltransferase
MFNVSELGQVFTPEGVVDEMLGLRRCFGRVLEPSCGDGAFTAKIPGCVGLELDPAQCGVGCINMDFFDYPLEERFDTIIGNPPYVRFQDIGGGTKAKLDLGLFDERSNLYLFFIEKCIRHLTDNGELIFIVPRDFLKATSSMKLNRFIFEQGTITDVIELGDKRVFNGFSPNCIIFRFEKGNFSRRTNGGKRFVYNCGQLLFTDNVYERVFKDLFYVKVGAVSGKDAVFANEEFGNVDFVCSSTVKTGKTKRMIFNDLCPFLEQHKGSLLSRKIKKFDADNWWQWGRLHHVTDKKRIYVNSKTRNERPFFTHSCNNYDGSVLAIFPKNQMADTDALCERLNGLDWGELGFVCDGRFLFSQKSLENTLIPDLF